MDLQYVFVVVATVLAGIHTARMDNLGTFKSEPNSKKIYCGTYLSQTLSAVCKGNYNTLNKKPEIYEGGGGSMWSASYTSESHRNLDYPYRSRASASSLITNFRRRRRRGVFNECCEKPCSHEELASYCGSRKR